MQWSSSVPKYVEVMILVSCQCDIIELKTLFRDVIVLMKDIILMQDKASDVMSMPLSLH